MSSVIILAGGQGKRMKSKTPKVLQKISSYPMIYHIIEVALKLSDDIHIVLYHNKEEIKEYLNSTFDNLSFHTQDYKNFPGTAGAIRNIKIKHNDVLILNGDMPLINEYIFKTMLENSQNADIIIGSMRVSNPYGYGRVLCNDHDDIIQIVEEKDANDTQRQVCEVNSGVYLITKEVLENYIPKISNKNKSQEFYLTDIISIAKKEKKIIKKITLEEKYLKGVNSKYELAIAEEMMQEEIKIKWMNEGIKMLLPSSIYIEKDVIFQGECELENNIQIKGKSLIKDSIIKANSIIENATIIKSEIGPMARIRPKSHIEESNIGNFVEVKNSKLYKTKAGHLSYLGDATSEEGVNIGAGTITCNYDGFKKHKTKIGKNVFIGSGVELVAPITIEDNVLVGAGSTIRENLSSGVLALSISKVKIIKDYFFDVFEVRSNNIK